MEHATLSYEGYDPEAEGLREALCTLGNGYVATRGAAPESRADGVHYPGTYLAGCYDRLTSEVDGRAVENEDLVNAPNWLPLTFRTPGQDSLALAGGHVLDHRQELDTRQGVLTRRTRFRDPEGRILAVVQRRLVSMHDPHVAALETTFVAENWSGPLEIRASLDGRVTNAGVARYRDLDGRHLVPVVEGYDKDERVAWLQVRTATSEIRIAQAALIAVTGPDMSPAGAPATFERTPGESVVVLRPALAEGVPLTVEKRVAVYTSRDRAISESLYAARRHAARLPRFDDLLADHAHAWERLWQVSGVVVPGEPQRALDLHVFHLLQTLSEHSGQLDVGMPARGLHGEAYRGHVFWDELFVFPFLLLRFPRIARSLLMYRWRRLPRARRSASDAGHRGAMYPWQSGSDGRDETQRMHLNPASGRWIEDHSDLQRHVGLAVAHNVWQYFQATGDLAFMYDHGAEMLVEIARFCCSLTTYDAAADRYDIRGVVGPDEYHDGYPGAGRPGIDNNAYTNVMVACVLRYTLDTLAALPEREGRVLRRRLRLEDHETELFDHVRRRMRVVFHGDGVISQFEGYGRLAELDWAAYRSRYDSIRRLDRILEAEGDSVNRYQASKQADVLMLVFLLGERGVCEELASLGYDVDAAALDRTVDYYLARTSHGSTLSAVVHAWVLASRDRGASWQFFREALDSDITDVQGGTTAEGVHLGAMAGTIDIVQRCYTGLDVSDGVLRLAPRLPPELGALDLRLRFRDHWGITVRCTHERIRIGMARSQQLPVRVAVLGREHTLAPGETWEVPAGPR
ncbi:glycoside hydrolase family 65 protein [Myceligenerans pegani]|uniref:Glycoside hydrolase family 65 protein n=1 Tax=Myceligenerans pegani TaxID=2776917 RepID=A0ABR9N3N3_9MICO|nr:glycoside hydrolase family 65 protein [Myceligenerans sp. TRM 65318]MBE1878262.1 glycoside hydrolase family 65 protein [Myceligenerans sp. TRM 65318]MBE3020533.1 glycoside hydrolase family 65 protein [Myceligenerans sp. TRM 65318]